MTGEGQLGKSTRITDRKVQEYNQTMPMASEGDQIMSQASSMGKKYIKLVIERIRVVKGMDSSGTAKRGRDIMNSLL